MRGINLGQFDLRPGDKVYAPNFDNDLSNTKKVKYRVISIHEHIFLAEKLSGSHRQVGFSKIDYLIGIVKKTRAN